MFCFICKIAPKFLTDKFHRNLIVPSKNEKLTFSPRNLLAFQDFCNGVFMFNFRLSLNAEKTIFSRYFAVV